jgi:predicted transposase/invertase (TIGR01784 family)
MLREKANFGVLEGLMTVLIGEEIKIVEILESESNQEYERDKFNRVDIKARNSKGEIILVEIQQTRELYFLQRVLYGVSKAITEHISLGEEYFHVKKVYSISILYFDLGQGADYLYHGQNRFVGVHTGDTLRINAKEQEGIKMLAPEDVFPEYFIIRVNEFNQVAKTPLEEWLQYLKSGIISPHTEAPGLSEAREKLTIMQMSPQERKAYERHMENIMYQNSVFAAAHLEGRAEGRAEGIAEGRAEGRAEGATDANLAVARKMKAKGFELEEIAEITGLGRETISRL